MKFNLPQLNKKKVIYIAAAVLVVIIIATGIAFTIKLVNSNNSNNNTSQDSKTDNVETVDTIMAQAIQLIHNDPAKAKTLLEQARAEYLEKGDKTGVVNVDAQLYLIAHPIVSK